MQIARKYKTSRATILRLALDGIVLSLHYEMQTYGDVILLIKPSRSQPYEANIFLRDDGQLRELPQATYLEFDRRAAGFLRHQLSRRLADNYEFNQAIVLDAWNYDN
jgi:hypothetical protein